MTQSREQLQSLQDDFRRYTQKILKSNPALSQRVLRAANRTPSSSVHDSRSLYSSRSFHKLGQERKYPAERESQLHTHSKESLTPSEVSTSAMDAEPDSRRPGYTELDRILLHYRPYIAAERRRSCQSFDSATGDQKRVTWSWISSFSVTEISNISILELPLKQKELFRSELWTASTIAREGDRLPASNQESIESSLSPLLKVLQQFQTDFSATEKVLLKALPLSEKLRKANHAWMMLKFCDIARLRRDHIEYDEQVIQSLKHLFTSYQQRHGNHNSDTISLAYNLAYICYFLHEDIEAEIMLKTVLERYERPTDLFYMLSSSYYLGVIYHDAGRREDAERMFLRAIKGCTKRQDKNLLYNSQLGLAKVYDGQNKIQDAESLYICASEGFKSINKPELVCECQCSLGQMFNCKEKYDDAEKLLTHALKESEKQKNSLQKPKCQWKLGITYMGQDRLDEAGRMFLCALEQFEKQLETSKMARCWHDLGITYRSQDKLDDAEQLLVRALDESEKYCDRTQITHCQYSLGVTYRLQDKLDDAEQLLVRALEQCTDCQISSMIPKCQYELGVIHKRQGRLDEAAREVKHSMEGHTIHHDASHACFCQYELGQIFQKMGDINEAERMYIDATNGFKKLGNHRKVSRCQYNLGLLYGDLGMWDDAARILSDANDYYVSTSDQEGEFDTESALGIAHIKQNRLNEAAKVLEVAVKLGDEIFVEDNKRKICVRHSLGHTFRLMGRLNEAEKLLLLTLNGFIRLSGWDHPDALIIASELEMVYRAKREALGEEKLLPQKPDELINIQDLLAKSALIVEIGNYYLDQGWFDDAEDMFTYALSLYRILEDEKGISDCIRRLKGSLAQKRFIDIYTDPSSAHMTSQVDVSEHHGTLAALHDKAIDLATTDDSNHAYQIIEQVLKGCGKNRYKRLERCCKHNYGILSMTSGDLSRAEEMLEATLSVIPKFDVVQFDHKLTLAATFELGLLYQHSGRDVDADRVFERVQMIEGHKRSNGKGRATSWNTVNTINLFKRLYDDLR